MTYFFLEMLEIKEFLIGFLETELEIKKVIVEDIEVKIKKFEILKSELFNQELKDAETEILNRRVSDSKSSGLRILMLLGELF